VAENEELALAEGYEYVAPEELEPEPPAEDPNAIPPELAGYVDEELGQAWSVKSLDGADWALKRIADLQAEVDENNRILEEHLAYNRMKTDALNAKVQRGIDFFTWHVKLWANENKDILLRGGKKKSRSLLHGTIGWRRKGGGVKVTDEGLLLKWAQTQPVELGFVRITEEPAIKAIKAWVEKSEELEAMPPGLAVNEATDELEIKAVHAKPSNEVADGSDS
jgi:phage host-nuclease inhibitor protein Gam